MRVLSIGNLYPPHHLGGYELLWRSATEAARTAGHEVRVLTTDHRQAGVTAPEDPDVVRSLRWYWRDHAFPRHGWISRIALERHNAWVMRAELETFRPDAIAWWGMGGMSLSLFAHAREAPSVAVVIDDWLLYARRHDAWLSGVKKRERVRELADRVTGLPTELAIDSVDRWIFCSDFIRRRALKVTPAIEELRTEVCHPGIQPVFSEAPPTVDGWRGQLLCVGRIDDRKGLDVAVRAMQRLPDTTLNIVGEGDRAAAVKLGDLVRELRLEGRVAFAGAVGNEALPGVYAAADVLLFPVTWDEPWGLVPLEAMASGTPVIATGTGGSAEYLRDEENCLLVAPGDDAGLATAVHRLAGDADLRDRLRAGGRETAARHPASALDERVIEALIRVGAGG